MAEAEFEDRRLNDRLTVVLSALGERPQASIPAACGGWAETNAAYRLFDNDRVTPEKVLRPHFRRSVRRAADHPVVLLVQDTTELDLTRPTQQVRGAGPLDAPSRRGALVHPVMAFTPDGTPLGCVWASIWTRLDPGAARAREQKQRRRADHADRGGRRAIAGCKGSGRRGEAQARQLPGTTCVCIADEVSPISTNLFAEGARGRPGVLADPGRPGSSDRGATGRSTTPGRTTSRAADSARPSRRPLCCSATRSRSAGVTGRSPARPGLASSTPGQPQGPGRCARGPGHAVRPPATRGLLSVEVNVVLVREASPRPATSRWRWKC